MSLQGFIDEINEVLRDVPGLNFVPDDPTEQVSQYPVAITYSAEGRMFLAAEQMQMHDNVTIAVFMPLSTLGLARTVQIMLPFRESIPDAIYKKFLGATPFTNGLWWEEITHTLGPIDWGGTENFGYIFTLTDVKSRISVST